MKYRTVKGQTVDEIVWKHYGNRRGAVETVLEANRGLADYGALLPGGLVIDLPDDVPPKPVRGLRLWD
ncbi:tail protein X [Candidatus Williamhamiltonella defendens]|uniref:Phage tail protein n=1 Tax=Candidatus Hamiltonella defensa (Bemisia tabaci) TaxID=672795 RepID=A0A249DWX6_9ENTR|nr:tail protein X [Candidatus Hamiltonella defensa]ASX25859.1 phage tail protein [Candidatus Hamiltonella defensa (Bemisia tabaci)]CED78164.1 Tail protein X [Candidatus Hamiltonella defensa (Bemisia tabaci)]